MAGTRIILFLCLCTLVFGSQCECESESLSHPGCGVIPTSSTIINGSAASYPWMVFLYNFGDTDNILCGGVLISDLEILTAAHCVNGRTTDELVVIIGSDNALSELRQLNYKTLFKIELYPLYYKNMEIEKAIKHSSDVAILTLEETLVLSSKVNPICLPSLDESEETYEGKEAIVAGWGKTETGETSEKQLMHVKVPIISNTECLTFYSWIMRFNV